MTTKTKTQLISEINSNFPDNTTGLITPALQRTTLIDMLSEALAINGQTVGYTLQDSDNITIVSINSAVPVTVTLPSTLLPGFSCQVEQEGAGQITFTAAAGATLASAFSANKTSAQYSIAFMFVLSGTGANSAWRLGGDITS